MGLPELTQKSIDYFNEYIAEDKVQANSREKFNKLAFPGIFREGEATNSDRSLPPKDPLRDRRSHKEDKLSAGRERPPRSAIAQISLFQ